MAQQVVIAGALFNDVPSISVPDSNSVWHPFVDPSVTTAAASDVASGKQFIAADGTLTTGTASGGGGTSIVWGPIRGDATLAKSWTYDKLIHADEGITIPSYSTSDVTLKSGASLASESLDFSQYSYVLIYRSLAIPIYSDSTKSSGRHIYHAHSLVYYFLHIPQSAFDHDGISASATTNSQVFASFSTLSLTKTVSYSSESSIRLSNSNYGAYINLATNVTASASSTSPYNTGTLTITAPNLMIRGNSSYLNRTNFEKITDIRYQYIFELWRVPQTATVHGWEVESQFRHIIDCANGNGTLS